MKLTFLKIALIGLAAVLPVAAAPKKVLVVTVTTGFRHASIPTSEKILTQLAAESGGKFTVDFLRQPAGEPKKPGQPRPGKDGDKAPGYLAALEKYKADLKVYEAALEKWMPQVVDALKPAHEWLFIGPGSAKDELAKHVKHHDHTLANRLIGVEPSDHPTDGQIVAFARKYFKAADRMIG